MTDVSRTRSRCLQHLRASFCIFLLPFTFHFPLHLHLPPSIKQRVCVCVCWSVTDAAPNAPSSILPNPLIIEPYLIHPITLIG